MIKSSQIIYYILEGQQFLNSSYNNLRIQSFEDVSSIFLNVLKDNDCIELPICLFNYLEKIDKDSEDISIPLIFNHSYFISGNPASAIKKAISTYGGYINEITYNNKRYYVRNNLILDADFIPLVVPTVNICFIPTPIVSSINLNVSNRIFTDKENKIYEFIKKYIFNEALKSFEYFSGYTPIYYPHRSKIDISLNYKFNIKVMDTSVFIKIPQVSDHEDFQETLIKIKDTMELDV